MSALMFGLVVLLGGLFCLAISKPLAKLVTNGNLFIHQDPDLLEAYRNKKNRGIRRVAKAFLVAGGVFIVVGLIGLSTGAW